MSPGATPSMAARSGRIGSKYGSGWATRTSLTPRHRRGVRSSVHTMIDTMSTTSAGAEPRRAEDGEDRQPIEHVDDAGAEQRVVARVEVLERGRVVGRRAQGEVRHLPDGHPDDRQQRPGR